MLLLDEINKLLDRIDGGENLTFVRYGDGEVMLATGAPVSQHTQAYQVDRWSSQGGETRLGQDMRLMLTHPEWIYGIPCQCCNDPLKHRIIDMMPTIPRSHLTFANMFVNAAYPVFAQWVMHLTRPVVLITNNSGKGQTYPFKWRDHMLLPDNCVAVWETEQREQLITTARALADSVSDTLFLFSGGPLKVLIHYMYEANPNNTYLDVGSAIDRWVHGHLTRPYQDRNSTSPYTHRNCTF